ncbi:MAG: hypothetical protein DMG52_30930 [Acidobacteria bacterium]|nr:MAG: hypothetical protein DMG52_30930 [Acidobacteriota bacterium]
MKKAGNLSAPAPLKTKCGYAFLLPFSVVMKTHFPATTVRVIVVVSIFTATGVFSAILCTPSCALNGFVSLQGTLY